MLKALNLQQKAPFILGGTFLTGILFFCFYQEWIIFHISFGTKPPVTLASGNVKKKNVPLFFWKNNRWQKEDIEILWSQDTEKTLYQLVNRWLSLADEEEVLSKKVTLQNATLSDNQNNVYLSFDRSLFSSDSSTFQKYMIIEGLLRTIKESNIKVLSIHFLVHHKPIEDSHLDFSSPWPIEGFLKSKK